mmetsp:Transcript_20202/g.23381  ORF Transcript_20202/g.23381 Transcript_20202/m.23381 type:complete len:193 (-) Transcript_20202:29-607(-)
MKHLQKRNKNYRDKFLRGAEGADLEKKQILEEQCRAASETLFKKRKEVQKLNKEYDDDMRRLMEIQTKQQNFLKSNEDYSNQRERLEKELQDQLDKLARADEAKNNNLQNLIQTAPDFDGSAASKDILLESEQLKTKYLLGAVGTLVNNMQDLQGLFEQPFQEIGLEIPQASERPETGSSQRSRGSQDSRRN